MCSVKQHRTHASRFKDLRNDTRDFIQHIIELTALLEYYLYVWIVRSFSRVASLSFWPWTQLVYPWKVSGND